MKKKGILLIAGIILISILAGCTTGSYISIGSIEKNTKSSMSMSYHKFSGTKSSDIKVKEGETEDVEIDIVTEDGSIDVSIDNENGESFYNGTDIATSSFTVTLEKAGDYKLSVNGKSHKGSYKISWSKRETEETDKNEVVK